MSPLLTNPFCLRQKNSPIVTSDVAFKGPYSTKLRSAPDNHRHPIAIQGSCTTPSNLVFFFFIWLKKRRNTIGEAQGFFHGLHLYSWQRPFFQVSPLPMKNRLQLHFPTAGALRWVENNTKLWEVLGRHSAIVDAPLAQTWRVKAMMPTCDSAVIVYKNNNIMIADIVEEEQ